MGKKQKKRAKNREKRLQNSFLRLRQEKKSIYKNRPSKNKKSKKFWNYDAGCQVLCCIIGV
jgi:hypothetical protein